MSEGPEDDYVDYGRLRLEYEARLGRMTLAWSQMESGLDLLIIMLFALPDLATIGVTTRPISLSQKLSLIRRAHKDIPALAPYREEGLRLADAISAVKNMRHQLSHGFVMDFRENGDVVLCNYRATPSGTSLEFPIMRKRKIDELSDKARTIFLDLVSHASDFSPAAAELMRQLLLDAEEDGELAHRADRRSPASERSSRPPRGEKRRGPPQSEGGPD